MSDFIVKGDLVSSRDRHSLECLPDGHLVVREGRIERMTSRLTAEERALSLVDYSGHLVVPGMCDLHIHAPQYQFRGLWMDMELLDWLNTHTFPEESKYGDASYAENAYSIFVKDLLSSPTTRLSAFATIHRSSALMLAELLEKAGLKGFVGKVNMDRNSPDILIEESDESVSETIAFIEECRSDSVRPIITPRFIPSCSDRLLARLGDIAYERKLPVQSHLSENLGEIEWVRELCPEASSYADAYRRAGLWGRTPTIMAHCVWSDTLDGELMHDGNIWIAHCPDSNTSLASGVANAKYFLDGGDNIGLGSDIAGGASLSLFAACTDAVRASKLRHRFTEGESKILSFPEAFYMATRGSGSFFGRVGAFEAGYEADFIVLDEGSLESTLQEEFTPADRLERYAYLAASRAVLHKCVAGNLLF